MHFSCTRQDLLKGLEAFARFSAGDRDLWSVVLSARAQPSEHLCLQASVLQDTLGLQVELPARVSEHGRCALPLRFFQEYVASLHQGELVFHRDQAQPEQLDERRLHISSASVSSRGTQSCTLTRLKVQNLPEQTDLNALTSGKRPLGTFSADRLRTVLAVLCSQTLAFGSCRGKPEMEHVLWEALPTGLRLTATSGTTFASVTLAPESRESEQSRPEVRALFEGNHLAWISKALPKEGLVELALAEHEREVVLLVSFAQTTLFCQGKKQVQSLSWQSLLQFPASTERLVARTDLERALIALQEFVTGLEKTQKESAHVALTATTTSLHLDLTAELPHLLDWQTEWSVVPVAQAWSVASFTETLVPLKLWRQVMALFDNDDLLTLELGALPSQQKKDPVLRFFRLSTPEATAMMSVSRRAIISGEALH